jgi:hypothetical protein
MRTTLVAVLVVLVLFAVPAGVSQTAPETDNTVTRVKLTADGDARWTVTVRTRLENDSADTEYERFQNEFRADTSRYLDPFQDRITGVVGSAANETGRSMRATNFTASTEIQQVPRRYGVVRYSFTWTNFAQTNGDAVIFSDVFGSGLFIAPDDTFVVMAPPGYQITDTEPVPSSSNDGTLTWVGPQEFETGEPSVRAEPMAVATTDRTEAEADTTGLSLVGLIAVLTAISVLGGGYVLYRRDGQDDDESSSFGNRSGDESLASPAGDDSSGAADTTEFVTDAERVEQLLAVKGGTVKQSAIATELDWSASKTSRVISSLNNDGRVEKRRIGRENVVALPSEID